jgi:hypothetical protein
MEIEIEINDELKKIDSELIQYLIDIPNKNNTITICEEYKDIYEIIKKNEYINIVPENIKENIKLVQRLFYFGNKTFYKMY